MHGRAISGDLHRGQGVQELLDERVYSDVGAEHWNEQQNRGEIKPGELRRGGTRNPIRVDISTKLHLGQGDAFFGSGEADPGNLFDSYFLRKYKSLSPIMGAISTMLVNKPGLGLLNPVTLAK